MSACSSGSTSGAKSTWLHGGTVTPCSTAFLPQARHPRMAVLHVEDRIVGRLARGHREVELERAVVAPGEEREARGVAPDLLQELLHQHEFPPALGHAHGLAVAQERHELHDQDVEAPRPDGPSACIAARMRAT